MKQTVLSREGQPRAFAQIYIHDGTLEAELEYPSSIWERGVYFEKKHFSEGESLQMLS